MKFLKVGGPSSKFSSVEGCIQMRYYFGGLNPGPSCYRIAEPGWAPRHRKPAGESGLHTGTPYFHPQLWIPVAMPLCHVHMHVQTGHMPLCHPIDIRTWMCI